LWHYFYKEQWDAENAATKNRFAVFASRHGGRHGMDRALSQQLTSLLGCPPTFLTDAWLRRVLQSVPFNNAAKSADCAFQHFLSSPIGDSCNSTLPDNIENIKNEVLAGPLVVQFDEVINIAENLENRHKDGQNRTLKFSITDGVRRVFGFEWRKIPGISANSQPGLKVR
jgi:hypothetical protein